MTDSIAQHGAPPPEAPVQNPSPTAAKIGEADVRAIAVEAGVDPRTVRKILAGKSVYGVSRNRVVPVLQRRGIAVPGDAPAAPPPAPAGEGR